MGVVVSAQVSASRSPHSRCCPCVRTDALCGCRSSWAPFQTPAAWCAAGRGVARRSSFVRRSRARRADAPRPSLVVRLVQVDYDGHVTGPAIAGVYSR